MKKITSLYKDLPIHRKLVISFSLVIGLSVLFSGIISITISRSYLMEAENQSLIQSMNQLNFSLDNFLEMYSERTNLVAMSNEVQTIMTSKVMSISDAIAINKKIEFLVRLILYNPQHAKGINQEYNAHQISYQLYLGNDQHSKYGLNIKPVEHISKQEWYTRLNEGELVSSWMYDEYLFKTPAIIYNRKIIHFRDRELFGFFQLVIPIEQLFTIINSNLESRNYTIFIVDDQGEVITSDGNDSFPVQEHLFTIKNSITGYSSAESLELDNERYSVGKFRSEVTGWDFYYIAPTKQILIKTKNMFYISLITVFLSLVLCSVIAYLISNTLSKRIHFLVKKADIIGEEINSNDMSLPGNDEFGQLDKQLDLMVHKINEHINREYKSKLTINRVRFELLQEQINPHLLYNTLKMVGYTAQKKSQMEIVEIVDHLSNFYKGILSRGKVVTTFREEFNLVTIYISLMRFVYNLNIDFEFEIEESLKDFYCLKLIIQPLVENAIIHGVKPKKEGLIALSAVLEGDQITITVSDDGLGMDEFMVQKFNQLPYNFPYNESGLNSFGLSNIIRRIHLFYGENCKVEIQSAHGEGTSITLKLPMQTKEEIEKMISQNNSSPLITMDE